MHKYPYHIKITNVFVQAIIQLSIYCDKINVGQIIQGEQSMSIFKDTRILAGQVIGMTGAISDPYMKKTL